MLAQLFAISLLSAFAMSFAAVDYRLQKSPRAFVKSKCSTTGLICSTCTDIIYCRANGDTFDEVPIGKCPSTQFCNDGKCADSIADVCRPEYQIPFQCSETSGVFPDPADCQQYHYCLPTDSTNPTVNQATSMACGVGYGYNPRSGVCDRRLVNNKCPSVAPVPNCNSLGHNGPIRDNPSIYFMCKTISVNGIDYLYPALNICENGKTYSSVTTGCR